MWELTFLKCAEAVVVKIQVPREKIIATQDIHFAFYFSFPHFIAVDSCVTSLRLQVLGIG